MRNPEQAKLVRLAIKSIKEALPHCPKTQGWINQCYHRPSNGEIRMACIDEILGTHGVEAVWGHEDAIQPLFTYCNSGDTYTPTIVRVGPGQYVLSTMGDEVERLERNGVTVI